VFDGIKPTPLWTLALTRTPGSGQDRPTTWHSARATTHGREHGRDNLATCPQRCCPCYSTHPVLGDCSTGPKTSRWIARAPATGINQHLASYPKSAIEGEGFWMQQVASGVGGLNPRYI